MSARIHLAGAAALVLIAAAAAAEVETPPVSYYPAADVAAAFAKGAVLFDGKDGRNYMIHASRREAAGMAEVHAKDADLIYVIEGTATLVTGGAAVDPRTVAPDEIRGTSIQGGETRKISKGDVLIVPRGTPHWFREVTNPFLYYVVKVR
ncbi:MAG TPA: cupin domain-containing protein [Thermoanaerobaculia bacterium]|nr:cupin domain-containing protein [Thermoanaerobaculia bacterium]